MTTSTQFKPTQRSEGSSAASKPGTTQNAVNASTAIVEGRWAKREADRAERELLATQAELAITCGVRGGR